MHIALGSEFEETAFTPERLTGITSMGLKIACCTNSKPIEHGGKQPHKLEGLTWNWPNNS